MQVALAAVNVWDVSFNGNQNGCNDILDEYTLNINIWGKKYKDFCAIKQRYATPWENKQGWGWRLSLNATNYKFKGKTITEALHFGTLKPL